MRAAELELLKRIKPEVEALLEQHAAELAPGRRFSLHLDIKGVGINTKSKRVKVDRQSTALQQSDWDIILSHPWKEPYHSK